MQQITADLVLTFLWSGVAVEDCEIMDCGGGLQFRVSAISAAFLGPIHQALSFAFLASAFAAALLGSGFGGVTTLAIAGAGGSKCEKTQSAPLLQLPFL